MLTHIDIFDFAIIDRLALDLDGGMAALTGETGAGKSILVDALGLALGDRADAGAVRHGAERAEITAAFDLNDAPAAAAWLEEHELASDGECVIRRTLTLEGRSRGYINGRPVPMQSLKELGELLVDIHGQHEHQSLLRRDTQRQLLDDYANNQATLAELDAIYHSWKAKTQEFTALREAATTRASRSELLRFQVQELEALALGNNEIRELEEEHSRLANAGRLLETCQQALTGLYEGEDATAHGLLSRIAAEVEALCDIDPQLSSIKSLLNEALIQVQESVDELRGYADRLDLDPGRLQWVEQRLGSIHDLSRKHHVPGDELPGLLDQLRSELSELDHSDERLNVLQDEIEALRKRYDACARQLGARRREAAKTLNQQVTDIIQCLGMPGARFEINIAATESATPAPTGLESIEFHVSTNPGQPLKPLTKVASGGELSRFSLAIQVTLAHNTRIPTLIYDEADTGIGGAVAEVVGRQLRALGEIRQVLCVTHLPQVAAQAHHHLQVTKDRMKDATRTRIARLTASERVEEIARMLGGTEITAQSRAHAEEMIGKAAQADPAKAPRRKTRA